MANPNTDPALFDKISWWTPDGIILKYIPLDWQRMRRSKLRNNRWNKLLRQYFRRVRSVRQTTGFRLPMPDFNTKVYENKRLLYLVVDPQMTERGTMFVAQRHAGDFLNGGGWDAIIYTKCQIIRTHDLHNIAEASAERLEREKINLDVQRHQLGVLADIQQVLSGNLGEQLIAELIKLPAEELAELTPLIS
jgi:hypothetical protein